MKIIYAILILIVFTSAIENESNGECFPDKGIKSAVISGRIKYSNSAKEKELENVQEIEYNKEGQPIIIKDIQSGTIHKREYEEGRLLSIITTRKKLPDFYIKGEEKSSIREIESVVDTAIISNYRNDEKGYEFKDANDMTWSFQFNGCENELITTLYQNGDTMQQVRKIMKDGVLVEHSWISFSPQKSVQKRIYFDYSFNKYGHWIKRSYESKVGTITEKRLLKYY